MIEKKALTCIGCPLGCAIHVQLEDGEIKDVSGYTCPRGKEYAIKEVTNPTRIVTSTMCVIDGERNLVSVKTKTDISKELIFACMEEINKTKVKAPIEIGDILIKNVIGTEVDVVATKRVDKVIAKSLESKIKTS